MLLSSIVVCSWWFSCLFLLHFPLYIGDDTQQHLKNITLERVTLDAMCDAVVNFEHMKELQCMEISDPQEVWILYTSVRIISVSCALKTPIPPEVRVRNCFLPFSVDDQIKCCTNYHL